MSDHVTITRAPGASNASFTPINCTLSEMVFWKNEDGQPHFPVFSTGNPVPALTYQVGPHSNSGSLQPGLATYGSNGPAPIPQGQGIPVTYACSLHAGESGTITVYGDFYPLPNQLPPATRGTAYQQSLINGGVPNYTYTVSNSNLPLSLKVGISSPAQGPVLSGTPGPNDAGSYAFDFVCDDSDGNNITQTYLLTIS